MDKQCLELFFKELLDGQKTDPATLNQIASDTVLQKMFEEK